MGELKRLLTFDVRLAQSQQSTVWNGLDALANPWNENHEWITNAKHG